MTAVIDVHHHLVPDFYRARLEEAGLTRPIPGVEYPSWTVGGSLSMMDSVGIDAAVLSVTEPGVHFAGAALARELARQLNEYLAKVVANHPTRFGAFAVVPLPDVDDALDEITYALDTLGLDGVGLLTNYGGRYLGDPALEPVLAELDRRAVPVFLHPARPAGVPTFGLPASLCEFPLETTRTVANLLYSGALSRHRRLRLIVSHAGGAVPFLAGRLADGPVITPALADRAPHDPIADLRRLYFDTALSANPYSLPSLYAFADPARVLFGTDYPFMPATYAARSRGELCRDGTTGAPPRDQLLGGNATAVFPRLCGSHHSRSSTR
jgi:predicted TIM-barrel fold metal-dependent hydrolase